MLLRAGGGAGRAASSCGVCLVDAVSAVRVRAASTGRQATQQHQHGKILVLEGLPLLPIHNAVHFPLGEVRLKVSDPRLTVMLEQAFDQDPPLIGVVSEYSDRPLHDHACVRQHLKHTRPPPFPPLPSAPRAHPTTNPAPRGRKRARPPTAHAGTRAEPVIPARPTPPAPPASIFQGVRACGYVESPHGWLGLDVQDDPCPMEVVEGRQREQEQQGEEAAGEGGEEGEDELCEESELEELSPDQVGSTAWRCAEVGTVVRLTSLRVCSDALKTQPHTHASRAMADTTPKIVTGIALQRFSVGTYKRALLGYWLADVTVLREGWGKGGRRRAVELMGRMQDTIRPQLASALNHSVKRRLLAETDPLQFSYIVPEMFPNFGVSALLSQAVLQCKTCVERLSLELHVVLLLDSVFGTRMRAIESTTAAAQDHTAPLSAHVLAAGVGVPSAEGATGANPASGPGDQNSGS